MDCVHFGDLWALSLPFEDEVVLSRVNQAKHTLEQFAASVSSTLGKPQFFPVCGEFRRMVEPIAKLSICYQSVVLSSVFGQLWVVPERMALQMYAGECSFPLRACWLTLREQVRSSNIWKVRRVKPLLHCIQMSFGSLDIWSRCLPDVSLKLLFHTQLVASGIAYHVQLGKGLKIYQELLVGSSDGLQSYLLLPAATMTVKRIGLRQWMDEWINKMYKVLLNSYIATKCNSNFVFCRAYPTNQRQRVSFTMPVSISPRTR